ncbi:unnamed protein product [Auanema sp. JU1783]|nr:unnamed protein product [Auanema sp. JU1783]
MVALPQNDTENLAEYMNQKGYAQLKTMIDEKQKENSIAEVISEFEANNTDLLGFIQTEDNKLYVTLVEAYHNASIYSVIRGIWNSQLTPILPVIDQVAILEYFAERKSSEALEMSFWAKLWAALRAWLSGKRDLNGGGIDCYADRPGCVRRAVENMSMETRIELDRAAREDNCQLVDNIITSQLSSFSASDRHEFDNWRAANQPPLALQHILNNVSDVEKTSLERLRKHDLIHSLKDYYRAMIESRPHHEQLELREFFEKMNNSFAGCYNPVRGQYEYN